MRIFVSFGTWSRKQKVFKHATTFLTQNMENDEENQRQQRQIEADAERATTLNLAAYAETENVVARFRAALRSGNPAELRAFMARHGYRLGSGEEEGEHMVLDEAMRDEHMPLEMVGLFFRELGGRFMLSQHFHVCVFSALINIDDNRWVQERDPRNAGLPTDDDALERWTARMAALVRYLVEDLRMPIRMPHSYRRRNWVTTLGFAPLIVLARQASGWAAYCAFRQYVHDDQGEDDEGLMLQVLTRCSTETVAFWARRMGLETLPYDAIQHLLERHGVQTLSQQVLAILEAEVARRAAVRVHMRALMMLPSKDASNAWARQTLEDPYLAHHILHSMARD